MSYRDSVMFILRLHYKPLSGRELHERADRVHHRSRPWYRRWCMPKRTSLAKFYMTMTELEASGAVDGSWGEATEVRGGNRPRLYEVGSIRTFLDPRRPVRP